VLARAGDPRSSLAKALGLLVPELCQQAVVDIYEPDGAHTFVTAFEDPELDQLANEICRRWPPSPSNGLGASESPGKSEPIAREVTEELLTSLARDAEHLAMLRQFGLHELLAVPLSIGARTLGTFTIGTDGGRRLSGAARLLAELIAERSPHTSRGNTSAATGRLCLPRPGGAGTRFRPGPSWSGPMRG
jgi:hypothetical protein